MVLPCVTRLLLVMKMLTSTVKDERPVPPPFAPKYMSSAYHSSISPSYFRRQRRRRATHVSSYASLGGFDDALANDQVGIAAFQQENVGPIASDPVEDTELFFDAETDIVANARYTQLKK